MTCNVQCNVSYSPFFPLSARRTPTSCSDDFGGHFERHMQKSNPSFDHTLQTDRMVCPLHSKTVACNLAICAVFWLVVTQGSSKDNENLQAIPVDSDRFTNKSTPGGAIALLVKIRTLIADNYSAQNRTKMNRSNHFAPSYDCEMQPLFCVL